MKLTDCVEIYGFDVYGQLVYSKATPRGEWLDDLDPVIDEDKERVRLQIRRVDGVILNAVGDIEKSWRNLYAENSTLLQFDEWQDEEPPPYFASGKDQLSLRLG